MKFLKILVMKIIFGVNNTIENDHFNKARELWIKIPILNNFFKICLFLELIIYQILLKHHN